PPSFIHHPASTLPHIEIHGAKLTVIVGEAFGHRSPVATLWPTLYVDALLPAGASLEVPAEHEQRAVYVVDGAVRVTETAVTLAQMAVLESGRSVTLQALTASRVMLLGGARFKTPRYIWWNFVSSSPERIERAKQDWRTNRFPEVPGETEFIPLPER
ncbi:MAG TPA: pirin-like C-terminal cupin domain-containing protein, partial [Rhodocyclaceae bacterium]